MGEWFQIITGVRKGCVLSPLIFALVVDWVMTRVMSEKILESDRSMETG